MAGEASANGAKGSGAAADSHESSATPAPPRRRAAPSSDRDALVTDSFLRPSFTLEQIRTFLAVASREHVTHAAQVLRLSQPAVTQQVQLLERALGIRLLERVGRNVRLTGPGVEVAGACLLIMRSLENLEGVVRAVRGLDLGVVTIGGSPLAANYYLPQVVTDFVAAHPRINVSVVVAEPDDVCDQVAAGHLECGLVDGVPNAPSPNLVRSAVAHTAVVIVAHPKHVDAFREADLEEVIRKSRYLSWSPGSPTEVATAQILGDHYECLQRLEIGSMEAARRSVLVSPGFITAMPRIAVEEYLLRGALVELPHEPVSLPLFAVRRQGPDSPAVEALWQRLVRRRKAD